ncbi:TetR/AcrR family transcriptional regulator [Nocardia sp. CS682]|uniref:TetR/AcrR family transcriptional regulator n=1 Tax=Nocardia sp. CS682 TaxID=1047172 RepID=UPI001074D70B|nr:TetR/AcrR family transcriptional regulator [Nocardia sp. CS682]QBS41192.1 TetR family transcriptional regulator [Nocardia sp. CS682]
MADEPAVQAKPVRRRRFDPHRRRRIAEAAIQVIGERGVEGLTHRAVAEAADVPIAGTTYHYKDKEDLLQAALEICVADYAAIMAAIPSSNPDLTIADVIDQTADALIGCFTTERTITTVQLELYVAAIRRPSLRPIADRFIGATRTMYAHYTDQPTATLLADAAQGITLRGMASAEPPTLDQIRDLLLRCLPR